MFLLFSPDRTKERARVVAEAKREDGERACTPECYPGIVGGRDAFPLNHS